MMFTFLSFYCRASIEDASVFRFGKGNSRRAERPLCREAPSDLILFLGLLAVEQQQHTLFSGYYLNSSIFVS